MKTCADCMWFKKDEERSVKLDEPIGTCLMEHCLIIGNFDACENCDGFDKAK